MADPLVRIVTDYPMSFFRSLVEEVDAAFAKAWRVTDQHYAAPERSNMLGQTRHAFCEEAFRVAAQEAGLSVVVPHTNPAGGRYSLVSHGSIHLIRCNVQSHCGPPRPTRFRRQWAALNAWLAPSQLDLLQVVPTPTSDRLCGMIVVSANRRTGDPTVPAFVGLGVPRSDLSGWVVLEPIQKLLARYHDMEATRHDPSVPATKVLDQALPRLKTIPRRKPME